MGKEAEKVSGTYKSEWLRAKVVQQNEKRKIDKKKGVKQPTGKAASDAAAPKKKKGATETDEQLLEIIEELKSDLKMRDEEFEQ